MIGPVALLLIIAIGVGAAFAVPGLSEFVILGVPCVLAGVFLLAWAYGRRPRNHIYVDGSNVMYWNDGSPSVEPLQEVVSRLKTLGYAPTVGFDANVGYKLKGRYLRQSEMARLLGLPESRVMIATKGTQADAVILDAAQKHNARVVSNDRFRDYADRHPETLARGHLIKGGYRGGELWLDV